MAKLAHNLPFILRLPNDSTSYRLIPNRRRLKSVLQEFWRNAGGQPTEVEVSLVDEPTIKRLHQQYLSDPSPTDIITFDLGTSPSDRRIAVICICLPIARAHAVQYKTPMQQEIRRLVIHGVLHLLGYDDHSLGGRRRMRMMENGLLREVEGDIR